jgi:putative membrane protein
MIDRFFGEEARAKVEAAVRGAEARSLGQIVPVVVEKCDEYPEARYRGALLLAGLATLAVVLFHLPVTVPELPLLQILAGVLGALLSQWDPVERLLVGRRELEESARERAVRAFHEHGLHRTERGTGVLVFAALFEHRAIVLGDRGIHEKMPAEEWQHAVDALVAGVRRSDPAAGFCEAIDRIGARLAEHFPRGPGAPGANEPEDRLRATRE